MYYDLMTQRQALKMMLESRSGPGSSVGDFQQGEVLQAMDALICPLQ